MKITFLDTTHYLFGNKGNVWTDSVHIAEESSSVTLCDTPMLSSNWAAITEVEKPGCLKCRTLYTLKSVSREDLIRVCMNNDHNGIYSDKATKAEGMKPVTKDDLTTIIMMWVIEEEMDENDINCLLKHYAKI